MSSGSYKALSTAGQLIGNYKIEALLGAGGMGEVYLATDKLGRKVALKLLPKRYDKDKQHVARFLQEAQTVLTLNHPNIVTLYDIGQTESGYYIASELIEGETLRQRLEKGIYLPDVLEIAIQVASALAAAHEKGIVHRDIKPENVMIRADGYVKVLDFGISKLTEQFSGSEAPDAPTRLQVETAEGVVMGTAPYMSPEQARGLRVDARTDIWSFGVLLYETVTSRKPFWGDTTQDILSAVLEKQPPPLSRYASNVPDALEWIVSKALRKDVTARYQSATELLADLKELRRRLEFEAEQERSSAPVSSAAARGSAASNAATALTDDRSVLPIADKGPFGSTSSAEYLVREIGKHKVAALIVLGTVVAAAVLGVYVYSTRGGETIINSLAVLPLVNVGADPETEYLSDGITESVINNLSRIGTLRLTARSTVFRYKGKDIDPQRVGQELGVDAVLTGRLVQRGDTLAVQADLVKVSDGSQIWGEQYSRKVADLVSLQSEISRDVSQKLRARLSGTDEQKLAKNYTVNAEAYRLYLKGRYHVAKVTRSQIQLGISYFQQAIKVDPSYALAYAGLADAYRALGLAGEMPPREVFPQAKAAAKRAVELDDTLAEAHAILGYIIFWYDWDWNAAEAEIKRAVELNPDSADAHHSYAHVLSNTGRHTEALAESKRARELDPLDLRINALGGQFYVHAGQADDGLALLQKVIELDSSYWLPHSFAASAYIEKGMFDQAVAEARKARELPGVSSIPAGFLGFALARSGKQAEARAVLEGLLKSAKEQYISAYAIAMIYNGLGERDQALAWLETAYQNREPRMAFLKVEPKWNSLRDDPRFQDLFRRVGLPN
jgi:serine/threonine protein kinase/TolB-like protein/Tfp pilus assembly protein PilF